MGWEGSTMLIRLNWHCNPTHDTFLESLGPQKLFRNSLHNFWSPSEWPGRSKVSKKRVLEGFGCIDADYDIVAPYIYIFLIIGTMVVLTSGLQDFLSSWGLLERSNMSKKLFFKLYNSWNIKHLTASRHASYKRP